MQQQATRRLCGNANANLRGALLLVSVDVDAISEDDDDDAADEEAEADDADDDVAIGVVNSIADDGTAGAASSRPMQHNNSTRTVEPLIACPHKRERIAYRANDEARAEDAATVETRPP